MGGVGSGNFYHWWRHPKKRTVEECKSIDAYKLTREGFLRHNAIRNGSWSWTNGWGVSYCNYLVCMQDAVDYFMDLSYRLVRNARPEQLEYRIRLETTKPHFGGLRWWFVCPSRDPHRLACNRRVAKLYLPPGERYFCCRQCHDLTYTSSQENHHNDTFLKVMAARNGWDFQDVKRTVKALGM